MIHLLKAESIKELPMGFDIAIVERLARRFFAYMFFISNTYKQRQAEISKKSSKS